MIEEATSSADIAVLVHGFLPEYDFSDTIETVVATDRSTTWDALMDADLIAVGLVGRFWRPVIAASR